MTHDEMMLKREITDLKKQLESVVELAKFYRAFRMYLGSLHLMGILNLGGITDRHILDMLDRMAKLYDALPPSIREAAEAKKGEAP
jgi:hypothetical protein